MYGHLEITLEPVFTFFVIRDQMDISEPFYIDPCPRSRVSDRTNWCRWAGVGRHVGSLRRTAVSACAARWTDATRCSIAASSGRACLAHWNPKANTNGY